MSSSENLQTGTNDTFANRVRRHRRKLAAVLAVTALAGCGAKTNTSHETASTGPVAVANGKSHDVKNQEPTAGSDVKDTVQKLESSAIDISGLSVPVRAQNEAAIDALKEGLDKLVHSTSPMTLPEGVSEDDIVEAAEKGAIQMVVEHVSNGNKPELIEDPQTQVGWGDQVGLQLENSSTPDS
jgi:hypothetical protein